LQEDVNKTIFAIHELSHLVLDSYVALIQVKPQLV